MRVLLLSDPGNIHTIRWATSLAANGIEVGVFGLNGYREADYEHSNVIIRSVRIDHRGIVNKLKYLTAVASLKQMIKDFKPAILHAHYATSYGLLGKLCRFKPLIISVWGSDVFEFPRKSFLHASLLRRNLSSATKVLSTSHVMARETKKYMPANPPIYITPFGIDLDRFKPLRERRDSTLTIGTIKSLYYKYGIDVLIESFDILARRHPGVAMKLIIVGDGDDRPAFQSLAKVLGIAAMVEFAGRVEHRKIPELLATFDIFAALSREESFGVAAIEASACEVPVVVSDAPGFTEVVEHDVTGIIVPKNNASRTADALERLAFNPDLRRALGAAGRNRVEKFYDWHKNVREMIQIYRATTTGATRANVSEAH